MGSILGAHLARAGHSVAMLTRGRRAEQVRGEGLRIAGLARFSTPIVVIDDPAVIAAIGRVTDACRAVGMPLGYFGVTAAAVLPYAARGYSLLVAGVDTLYLANGAKALLAELRDA